MLCTTAGIFYKSRGRQSDNLRTDYPHQSQGDTLGGINLTLIITAPMEEVIRVQTYHHLGAVNAYPAFEINAGAKPLKTDENDERIIIYSGSLALEIGKKHWYMRYTRNGKLVTESKAKDLAPDENRLEGACLRQRRLPRHLYAPAARHQRR